MERVSIPVGKMLGFAGKPMKGPKRDDNGEAVLKDGNPEFIEMDTRALLREFILGLTPRGPYGAVQKAIDSIRVHQLWNEMEASSDGVMELKPKVYEWLHDLLKRQLPLTKEQKDNGAEAQCLAQAYWGLHWAVITNQLLPKEKQEDMMEKDRV